MSQRPISTSSVVSEVFIGNDPLDVVQSIHNMTQKKCYSVLNLARPLTPLLCEVVYEESSWIILSVIVCNLLVAKSECLGVLCLDVFR